MSRSTFVRGSLALVVLSVISCGGREPPTVVVAPAPVAPVVTPTATAKPAALPDDPKANLLALVCSKRESPCELVREHDAGKDARKRELSVALFFVAGPERSSPDAGGEAAGEDDERALEQARGGPLSPQERDPGLELDANGERFSMSDPGSCFAYEYWRIVREGGAIVEGDKIADVCNDGNGAAGVGEDEVTVFPNEVHIATSGGSSWRWSNTVRYSLSPFVRRWSSSESFWTLASNREESHVDWQELRGATAWTTQACDPDGQMMEGDDGILPEHSYDWIPTIALDPGFVASGWKATSLHECAASIDASGRRGHVITGREADDAGDARVKVLAAKSGELFVEVIDDVVTGPTARPASDDHLEVWVAPAPPAWDTRCIDPKDTKGVVAWDVRVADGKVTAGFGKPQPKSLAVERAADPDGTVRFKLGLPAGMGAVTLAYADSDAGGKIERRIATSALDGGRVATLGKLAEADRVRCTAQSGGLVRELLPEKLPMR